MLERGKVKGRVLELTQFNSNGINLTGQNHGRTWADWIFDSLNVYVGMQLMWNLDQNVETMLDEYYKNFYGSAEPLLQKFYAEMEAAFMNLSNKGRPEPSWDWSGVWLGTYPPEFVERVMGYLRHAEVMTRGQKPFHTRVVRTLKGFMPFEIASKRFTTTMTRLKSKGEMGAEFLPPG